MALSLKLGAIFPNILKHLNNGRLDNTHTKSLIKTIEKVTS